MFFVRGLSYHSKEVLINPDQVLYVRPGRLLRGKTVLVLTHRKRLKVDQDTETVRLRFEDYLNGVQSLGHVHHARVDNDDDRGGEMIQ